MWFGFISGNSFHAVFSFRLGHGLETLTALQQCLTESHEKSLFLPLALIHYCTEPQKTPQARWRVVCPPAGLMWSIPLLISHYIYFIDSNLIEHATIKRSGKIPTWAFRSVKILCKSMSRNHAKSFTLWLILHQHRKGMSALKESPVRYSKKP